MKARHLVGPALVLCLAASARAQGLSLSLSSGAFYARQDVYREIYGTSFPLSVEARFELKGGFGVSAGLIRLRDNGRAVAVDGGGEDYPLRFDRLTIPLTLFLSREIKGVVLLVGAGLAYHSYREKWRTVDLVSEGKRAGPRAFAAVEWPVLGRLSVLATLVYESIGTGVESPLGGQVDLGGMQVLGGIAFRVF